MQNENNTLGNKSFKSCPHCKLEIDKKASRCPHCHGKIYVWTAGRIIFASLFVIFMLMIVVNAVSPNRSSPSSSANVSTVFSNDSQITPDQELLELVSYRCYSEYSFFHVTGEVKNISGKPLDEVQVVGNAYTKNGELVKSGDALIKYNPVLAGQTSPFEVIMTGNPEMAKCTVSFKYLLGGTINTKHSE